MNATWITIAGNLAERPELKVTTGGKATTRTRVAVTVRHRDQAGEWVDGATSWYTVIAWNTLAEHTAQQLTKGQRVIVHGRLEQRDWTTETGETCTAWELTAEDLGPSLRLPIRGGVSGTWAPPGKQAAEAAPAGKASAPAGNGARRWAGRAPAGRN